VLINNRLIWNDNGVLKDLSINLNNVFSGTEVIPFTAAQDKLYIGSDLPFNHRYILVDVANDAASVMSADIWDGTQWISAVDVIDQTVGSAGKSLSQSGIMSWVVDRNHTWGKRDTTELMTGSGLESVKIYEMFWVRLTFSGNWNVLTALKYVGHKFSSDNDLGGYYPDLNRSNVMSAFKAGKTNWDEQHVLAAEEIIRDLRKKNVIWNGNQIFGWEEFTDASVHKVAEIAFTAFGKDYESRKESARNNYEEALLKVVDSAIDKDADGRLSPVEKVPSYGRLFRR
jgi:hypothetical protein